MRRVRIKIKLYTQAQFISAFIVLTDVWLFLNILNYTNTKQMRGGHHQDSYCVLWGWHLTASRFEGRVPNRVFGIWDFHYLKLGIRDLKEKFWGNSVFLGNKRKFRQNQFLKTSPWLFDYFEDLNINLKSWSRRNDPVIFTRGSGYLVSWVIYIFVVFYCWALYCTALAGMGYFQLWID